MTPATQPKAPSPGELQRMLDAYTAGRMEQAEQLARQVLGAQADSAVAHSVLASALALRGQGLDALPHFEQAARLQPQAAELQFNHGLALTGLGQHGEAMAAYRRALRLKPAMAVAHFNLGAAQQALGDFAGAADSFQHAIDHQPGYLQAWGNPVRCASARVTSTAPSRPTAGP